MQHTFTRHAMLPLCLMFGATIACGDDDDKNNDNNAIENSTPSNNDPAAQRVAWEQCRSTTTEYARFNDSVSTIARIIAFEEMADLLWLNNAPTTQNFVDANLAYLREEGLDSRVGRREDEHYAAVMKGGMAVACNSAADVPLANPERCVGPAQMQPLLLDALTRGAMGEDAAIEAARVEAGLLWFLYLSTHKEALTCGIKKADCDSAWAYYGGGEPRSGGLGLAGYYRRESMSAHEATWDGLIAMRCWREVDSADTATNNALRDEAVELLDEGLLHGYAHLISNRVEMLGMASDEAERNVLWTSLQILGPTLDRAATERDAAKAQTLRTAFATQDPTTLDTATLATTIEGLFPAP